MNELGWWGVPLAILGGAIRVGTPLLWVSLGETVRTAPPAPRAPPACAATPPPSTTT